MTLSPTRGVGVDGLSLARRLALTFIAIALVIGAVVGVAIWAYVRQVDARHQVVDVIDPARVDAADLLADYVDEETGVRGYVLTSDKSFLQPYEQALAATVADRARLMRVIASDGVASRRLAAFDAATERWQTSFATPAIRATEARNPHFLTTAGRARPARRCSTRAVPRTPALDSALSAERGSALADPQRRAGRLPRRPHRGRGRARCSPRPEPGVAPPLVGDRGPASGRSVVMRDGLPTGSSTTSSLRSALPMSRRSPSTSTRCASVSSKRSRLVEQARSELEAANADLARSNVELEQFAYVASHDLQEPLRKVVSFCQLLQRRYGGQLDARADEYIAFAVDGATRMQVLINDLLAFSRVGRSTTAFVPVDLGRLVVQATADLRDVIDEARATVESGTLPTVAGDPTLLAALFANLLGNALKFRGEAPPVVTVAASKADDEWLFSVADNGIGIEPRFAERVFVIFQRLHGRDVYSGTGIGLALCKKIVEFHGGRIWVDRGYHPGTRICWTLPVEGAQ